jgi:hypothetical protein
MKPKIHLTAGIIAFITILTFFSSTVIVELLGDHASIAKVKELIVCGLFVLVPAIATTGITGFMLARSRKGPLVDAKKRRMPVIGANGILILLPSAIVLNHLASAGNFGGTFYAVQALELVAGALNIALMSLNIRDGLTLAGRIRH